MRDEDQAEAEALFHALPVAAVALSPSGDGLRVVSANALAQRAFGAAVGAPAAAIPPFATAAAQARLDAALADGGATVFDAVAPDGGRARARAAPWRDGLVVTLEPTDADPQAEAERDRLALAARAARIGVWEYHPQTGRLIWNDVMHQLTGVAPETFSGRIDDWTRLLAPEHVDLEARLMAGCATSDRSAQEVEIVTPQGERRWLAAVGLAVARDAEGRPTRLIGVNYDISDRRDAEMRARAAERRLAEAVEALPDGFAVYDAEDRLAVFNTRYREVYPESAPAIVLGATYEAVLRYGLAHGQYPDAVGREEAWLADAMRVHRRAEREVVQPLPGDRWMRIVERLTPGGDRVGARTDVTDLIRQQQALEAARAEAEAARDRLAEATDALQRFFDISADLMGVGAVDGTILAANRAWTDLLGHPVGAVVGRPHLDFVHPDDAAATAQRREDPAAGEPVFDFVARMRCADGGYRTVEWRSTPDAEGRVHFVGRDVTAREAARREVERARFAAEDALALLEAKSEELERFFDLSLDLMGVTDPAGRFLRVNRAWADVLGRDPAGLIGRHHLEVVHPDDLGPSQAADAEVDRTLRMERFVQRVLHEDGHARAIEWRAARTEDGFTVFTGRDVTDARAALAEIEEARDRLAEKTRELEHFFDVSLDLLGVASMDGRFLRLNRAWSDLLGMPLDDILGAPFIDLVHPEDREATLAVAAQIRERRTAIGFVNRYRRADGGWASLEWRSIPVDDRYVYFAARDVTAREQALREKARQAAEERALTAVLSLALTATAEGAFLEGALDALAAETGLIGGRIRGVLLLADAETGALTPVASRGVCDTLCEACRSVALGLCLCGRAAGSGSALYEARPDDEPGDHEGRYASPIRDGERLLGVLTLLAPPGCGDDAAIGGFLDRIADALALGLARRRAAAEADAERRRALDALAALEGFNRALDRHAIVSVTDRAGVIIDVNDRFCEATGFPRAALLGASHRKVSSGRHDVAFWREMWRKIVTGEPWRGEVCNLRADGEEAWFDTTIIPVLDGAGRPVRFVALRFDVSERRRVSERLAAANRRLEQIAAISGVGGWAYDPATDRMTWDARTRCIHDVADDFTPTRDSARAFYAPDARPTIRAAFEACLAEGTPYDLELPLVTAKGRAIWVRAIGQAVEDDAGRRRLMGSFQDVTERRAREARAERLRARFEALIANTDAAVFIKDRAGRFLLTNPRVNALAGRDDLVGRTAFDVWPRDVAERLQAHDRAVFESGEAFTGEERVRTPDGEERAYLASKFLVYDAELEDHVLCGVSTDVTELKSLQASLEESRSAAEAANVAKSRFLATMSHEIRTPMNGVIGMADLLDRAITDPKQKRMIGVIRESGEVLLNVINDILDFSKLEVGKMTVETTAFLINEVARKVESIHALKAAEKGLGFRVTVAPDARAPRLGDPYRLQQVLHNLVSNAVKFTERGAVEVTIAAVGAETVRVAVADTGIGMTEAAAARIFDAFAQADDSTTRRFGGTGLGMAIVRGLVDAMGGALALDSAPGRGTTVTIDLPLPLAADAVVSAPTDDAPPPGLRALAADDNDVNRMVVAAFLKALGVEGDVVDGGRAAVEARAAGDYDVLLLDISMPEVNGIEALAMIRAHEAETGKRRIPALAVTANALSHQVEEYRAAGFDGHLPKPLRRDALIAALRRHAAGSGAGSGADATPPASVER